MKSIELLALGLRLVGIYAFILSCKAGCRAITDFSRGARPKRACSA